MAPTAPLYSISVSRDSLGKSALYREPPTAREVAWLICAFTSIPYEELEEAFLREEGLVEGVNSSALQGYPLGYSDSVLGVHFTVARLEE